MTAYHYSALDKSGKAISGVMQGDSPRIIRQQLRDMGLSPLEVTVVSGTSQTTKFSAKRRVKQSDLALLTRQLATLLSAGLPVEECLLGVSEQIEKSHIKGIIQGVRSRVLEGHSLAAAMRYFPQAFPELYCATVGSGEQTGRLDVVLNRLADYTEQQQEMRQKIQQALIYPLLMTLVSIAIVAFLLSFVVPRIVEVFTNTGQTLPNLTLILINISYFVRHFGLYVLIILIIALLIFRRSLKNEAFKYRWHRMLLKTPLIGFMIRSINTARFSRTFGILSAAGVPVLEAMRVSTSLVTSLPIHAALSEANTRVREGGNINLALKQTRYFSPMAIHLIASGEASGQLEAMLGRAANHQDNEISRLIATGLTLLEPLIIILMGAVVLFIVLAILLPIFELDQFVG